MKEKKLFIIQVNEVNFDLVEKYINKYHLPNLKKLISNFNLIETSSEKKYHNLEPWIQWVSFYTGKSADEHKIFHLNDTNKNMQTFYKEIENSNKLLFMFPMNLKNNFNNDTFFFPDPWTDTNQNTNSKLLNKFYEVAKKMILQNQSIKLNFDAIINIILVFFKFTSLNGKLNLIKFGFLSIFKRYYKALFFDFLVSEISIKNINKSKTNINTIFFNAAAHIQHHYLLSSEFYKKKYFDHSFIRNDDPIFECYKVYDKIVGNFLNQKNTNYFFVTGLSQEPIVNPIYYWNLKSHENFFTNLKIPYKKIVKRMSRDYTLHFENLNDLKKSINILKDLNLNKKKIFSIKEEENKIYLELVYDDPIYNGENLYDGENNIISKNFFNDINFVAVKNSIHNEKGYVFTDLNFDEKKLNIKDFYNYFIKNYA